jgi:lipoprotein-releasing system ATP-binding protein
MRVLSASKICKRYYEPTEIEILREINLELFEGESIAITGASGEGKSTLLHILGTLEPATSGELKIHDELITPTNRDRIRNQEIGFVFQGFHLLEEESAIENVMMPARIGGKRVGKKSEAWARAEELLVHVGLSERIEYEAKRLSGGERQRVALARALCNDPSLILADEPTGNLDHKTSEQIHRLLLDFSCGKGKALIIVTHDPELANLCQRTLTLIDGVLHRPGAVVQEPISLADRALHRFLPSQNYSQD